MNKISKFFSGLVGRYLKQIMPDAYSSIAQSNDYDLTREHEVELLFKISLKL